MAHVSALTDCAKCHDDTTTDGASVTTTGEHVDGVVNVAIAAGYDTNDGTKYDNYVSGTSTCSNLYCHNTGEPVWGGASLACDECHGASSALPGTHSTHYANASAATDRTAGRIASGRAADGWYAANPSAKGENP